MIDIVRKFQNSQYIGTLMTAVITSAVIVVVGMALPMTESLNEDFRYNLNIKDDAYQERTFTVELNLENVGSLNRDDALSEVKSIFHRRLSHAGVEEVVMTHEFLDEVESDENDSNEESEESQENEALIADTVLYITTNTTRPYLEVDQLIQSSGSLELVVPNEEVDFQGEENFLNAYLPENYSSSGIDQDDFRNIPVKKLATQNGESAYFAIFKPNIFSQREYNDFLEEYSGDLIGVEIDQFVSPVNVPAGFGQTTHHGGVISQTPEFSFSVGSNEEQAELFEIIYTGKAIESEYRISDLSEPTSSDRGSSYPDSLLPLGLSVVLFIAYIGYRNRENLEEIYVLATNIFVTLAILITYLKLSGRAVDTDVLTLVIFSTVLISKLFIFKMREEWRMELIVLLGFIIVAFFGDGHVSEYAQLMASTTAMLMVVQEFARYYLNNIRQIFTK